MSIFPNPSSPSKLTDSLLAAPAYEYICRFATSSTAPFPAKGWNVWLGAQFKECPFLLSSSTHNWWMMERLSDLQRQLSLPISLGLPNACNFSIKGVATFSPFSPFFSHAYNKAIIIWAQTLQSSTLFVVIVGWGISERCWAFKMFLAVQTMWKLKKFLCRILPQCSVKVWELFFSSVKL